MKVDILLLIMRSLVVTGLWAQLVRSRWKTLRSADEWLLGRVRTRSDEKQ